MHYILALFVTFYALSSLLCRADECSEEITSNQGSINSPNYPKYYDNNLECTWRITASRTFRIRLQFFDFQLKKGWLGCRAVLTIWDGKTEKEELQLFKSCEESLRNLETKIVVSSGNKLLIKLTPSIFSRNIGFAANFTTFPESPTSRTTKTTEPMKDTALDAHTVRARQTTTGEAEVHGPTSVSLNLFDMSSGPTTNHENISQLSHLFSSDILPTTPVPSFNPPPSGLKSFVAFYLAIPFASLLLCVLATTVFINKRKKKSKNHLCTSPQDAFYQNVSPNIVTNGEELPELFTKDSYVRRENPCTSSESENQSRDIKEKETNIAPPDEGDVFNSVYESYDGKQNEAVVSRQDNAEEVKLEKTHQEEGHLGDRECDDDVGKAREWFENNIIYESYDKYEEVSYTSSSAM